MKTVGHAPEKPEELLYVKREDGMADVWMRRNISPQAYHSDGDGENLEYVYDEIFFRTEETQEDIENNFDIYWKKGAEWEPTVPLTEKEQIEHLQKELEEAKTNLSQARTDNDMAIAELTIVLATMMASAE